MYKEIFLIVFACNSFLIVFGQKGFSDSIISLNGKWNICLQPKGNFWEDDKSLNYQMIQVPGECEMQGFKIKHDQPLVYKKEISISPDFRGKVIRLRFEGVYSYARLWVNGKYIREHSGGFTSWEADITKAAEPGKSAVIILEVTDKADEISYASGYAKHPIGGILRNVSLISSPLSYPEQVVITTDFDENYQDASLKVSGIVKYEGSKQKIGIELFDKANRKIVLANNTFAITDSSFEFINLIKSPLKWDAEHPNLYKLRISLSDNKTILWARNYSFGFREIEVKGNRFLVNGQQVKLRGACHHDIHPLLGRVSTPEYELKDVLLAKEANINFIRTSHYPPTDNFLQLCDRYGIYVEDETAVCFVNTYRSPEYAPGSTENSSEYTGRYLSQLREMVENHRNHPSVILWSIGNENKFGSNFQKSYDWVKKTDPSRPVIFSFPGTDKKNAKSFDILSMHYPGIDGNLEQYGAVVTGFGNKEMPVLFDEWAHVPCYNNSTIKEDPNVRDFWGTSLDSMWQKTYDADGGLGGAIWGMIDESFMLPDTVVGYGEWGIYDTWRRKKPEFWNVKKAYSPVRILSTKILDRGKNTQVKINLYNRFDHTDISELKIRCRIKDNLFPLISPEIPPHHKGILEIPVTKWPLNEQIVIEFFDQNNSIVDSYSIVRKEEIPQVSPKAVSTINLLEEESQFKIQCANKLEFIISKATGLFSYYQIAGKKTVFIGPYLNLRTKGKGDQTSSTQFTDYGTNWKLNKLSVIKKDNLVEISLSGNYNNITQVGFVSNIFSDGSVTTAYSVTNIAKEYVRETGIKFILDNNFKWLDWERIGYWDHYPPDHLSAMKGATSLYTKTRNQYSKEPAKDWQYDTKSFYYDGISDKYEQMTFIAKATKENILRYILRQDGPGSVSVSGTGNEACRIDKRDNRMELIIDNLWDYPDLAWGNYQKNILLNQEYSAKIGFAIK